MGYRCAVHEGAKYSDIVIPDDRNHEQIIDGYYVCKYCLLYADNLYEQIASSSVTRVYS